MRQILNLDPEFYSEKAKTLLREVGSYAEKKLTRSELLSEIENVEVLLLRFSHRIDSEVLSQAKKLKVIATNATGLDHLEVQEIEKQRIKIFSLKGETPFLKTIHATAEHTWGLLLALLRHVPQAIESVKDGHWKRNDFVGNELHGKTIGIVGLGRIGEKIARYAQAFSMKVLAMDPLKKDFPGVTFFESLDDLLRQSHILTLHVPLSESTIHLINEAALSKLPKGSWLLNTSRGKIVDEWALLKALKSGHLAGAALDVLESESQSDFLKTEPLRHYANKHDNLILTPHIGGAAWESWEKTEVFIAQKICEHLTRSVVSA